MVNDGKKSMEQRLFAPRQEVRSKIQRLFLEQLRKQGEDDLDEARFLAVVEFLRQVFMEMISMKNLGNFML